MKQIYSLLVLFIAFISITKAQIITSEPNFPTANDSVYIYFDATKGNQGLMDYTGDVYAHIGVITDKSTSSSDWKYVKTAWGENTPETKLERISANYYRLKITPSITQYFQVPAGEKVQKIALVFRSSDSKLEGKDEGNADIFCTVYDATLSLAISSPDKNQTIFTIGDSVKITIASAYADSMQINLNDEILYHGTDSIYDKYYKLTQAGSYKLVAKAFASDKTVSDSTSFYTIGSGTVTQDIPAGLHRGLNIIDNNTVYFVLWAPNKNYVFLTGDFNNWELSDSNLMKRDSDGSTYWLKVSGLDPNKEYVFQYFVDGSIRIADPYTEKISDPWNDKWIPDSIYPNLIAYPEGKAQGTASTLKINQEKYMWQTTNFTAPEANNLRIYELHVRDFVEAGSFRAVMEKLDYLENLGINAIEFMPVSEFEGNDSWGYNPSFYFAVDKAYGTKNDYKKLIDECHKRGIAVIQDIVFNHSYGQSPLVLLYMDGDKVSAENPWYNVSSPNTAYSWGYDFNHESSATKAFVDSSLQFWLTEYKIDGFRFDFTKGFTNKSGDGWAYDASRIAILSHYNQTIKKVNKNAYTILEHFTDNSEEKQLVDSGMMIWGNTNYNYLQAGKGLNTNGESDFSWISYQKRGWSHPGVVGYFESHDEERLMYEVEHNSQSNFLGQLNLALPRAELDAVFLLTIPGPKMIWQFGELGYDYSINENGRVGRKPIRWDYFENASRKRIYDVYAALNKLRTDFPLFNTDSFSLEVSSNVKSIHLYSDSTNAVILGNFDSRKKAMIPGFPSKGTWYEFFSGDSLEVNDTQMSLELEASEYRIYTTQKLAKPEISAAVKTIRQNDFKLYPNPTSTYLQVKSTGIRRNSIKIYDVNGKLINLKVDYSSSKATINTSGLNAGFYIIHFVKGNENRSGIFVKE